ncbi:MAG: T9SS type A sorting domain-containing protein [Bacteroidetes bacterium]|nr:T9SS type A sorting domain-containing protein [Bacteroidota bacterium]
MKKITLFILLSFLLLVSSVKSQTTYRYKNEVFTDAQLSIAKNITYGININWLIINQTDLGTPSNAPQIISELTFLKTKVLSGQAASIPLKYFYPKTTPPGDSTILKVTQLKLDAYMPSLMVDTAKKRPVIIYLHTGNFLPPGINGSPCGAKNDSVAVDLCKAFARRGYVVLCIDYRLGWNPLASTVDGRRAGLLNAVYRSIQDVKECVRVIKSPNMSPYKLDTANIALFGEGSGAYLAHAYNTLDKYPEFMVLPKFAGYIDTSKVGYIDGTHGLFNLYANSKVNTKIKVIGTIGGALADTTWLEAGDAPTISMQCVRDPFAPFGYGMVKVPNLGLDVVEVDGANNTIARAQRLGNNSIFATVPSGDPYTIKARSLYNKTVDYIYPAPADKITIRNGEGMYPFLLPKASSVEANQASPWQWWDPNSAEAKYIVQAPSVTAHMAASASNSDMSKSKSRIYQDTILGFVSPRFALVMGYLTAAQLSTKAPKLAEVKIYPNPASNNVNISYRGIINYITITDLSGKTVYSTNVNDNFVSISTLSLKTGLYLVNINTNDGSATQKLLID